MNLKKQNSSKNKNKRQHTQNKTKNKANKQTSKRTTKGTLIFDALIYNPTCQETILTFHRYKERPK